MSVVLVTGSAGFIGSNLVDRLLKDNFGVIGVDNFNDYYDPKIKERNLIEAKKNKNFTLFRGDILDLSFLESVFKKHKPEIIVHLAARAGVRPSIDDPLLYADVNKMGTLNLLELAIKYNVEKFVFASSSSVYGNSMQIPFVEDDTCTTIISPYGASKRAGELFVESFYKNYGLRSVVLRFFTVYGPRGRPDMAPAIFASAILNNEPVEQFGAGTKRDYTFIDDIIDGIVRTIKSDLSFEILNFGNGNPVAIEDFIRIFEKVSGRSAKVNITKKRVGDVDSTWSNVSKAKSILGWKPKIGIEEGLSRYFQWLKNT